MWWKFVLTAAAGALVFLVVQTLYQKYVDKECAGCKDKTKPVAVPERKPATVTGIGAKNAW